MTETATAPGGTARRDTARWRRFVGRQCREVNAFFLYGTVSYLVLTFWMFLDVWRRSGHRVIYVFDDAAIHLVVARNLAYHFTWGIEPHHYQSASSSVVWTLLLAAIFRVLPLGQTYVPLLLNVAASVLLIFLLGKSQKILMPSWKRPWDVLSTVIVVNVILFLPALSFLGMEHVLEMLAVLAIVLLLMKRLREQSSWGPDWLVFALIALAELVRFETVFVAAGFAVGIVMYRPRSLTNRYTTLAARLKLATALVAAAVAPLAAYGVFNRAMGQGWFSNTILARANGLSALHGRKFLHPRFVLAQLAHDRLLVMVLVVCVGLSLAGLVMRHVYGVLATATVMAIVLQGTLAGVGQYFRYESADFVLAVMTIVLALEAHVVVKGRRRYRFLLPGLMILLTLSTAVVGFGRVQLTADVPRAAADVYDQKYMAGEFLQHYYPKAAVVSGELGWMAWLHLGPFVDVNGLGSYRVLQELRRTNFQGTPKYWREVTRGSGALVAVIYPENISFTVPRTWTLVGEWILSRHRLTALDRQLRFYATTANGACSLKARLVEFAPRLPDGERLNLSKSC